MSRKYEKYGVTSADVERRRGEMDEPKEKDIIGIGTRRTVVPTGEVTAKGKPVFRPATPEERVAISIPSVKKAKRPTTREEFAKSFFERQRKIVKETKKGLVVEEPKGMKFVLTPIGETFTVPREAKVYPKFIRQMVKERREPPIPISKKEARGYVSLFREKIQERKPPEGWLGLYERAEAKISPYAKRLIPLRKYDPERATFYDVMLPKRYAKPVKIRAEALGYGMIKGIREKPIKAGLMFGAFFALGGALRLTGMGLAATGVKIWKPIKLGFAVGLPALYGLSLKERLKRQPTPKERWGLAGEITTTEIAPMFAGGLTGELVWPGIFGRIRTRGMKRVPPEEIIERRIAIGEETFPTAPTRVHLKKFLEPRYRLPSVKEELGVWHATPEAWTKRALTQIGKRELPGTYVAPSLSGYFLRVQQERIGFYGAELFPTGRPTALYIYPKGIKGLKMPRAKMYQYLLEAPKGKAFVPGIKGEIEALIPPETRLIRTAKQFYTQWRGVRIPIHEYKVAGLGIGISKKIITPKKLTASYYSYFAPKAATSPLGYALLKSLTTLPYKPSYVPSYKPSLLPSYKPSKVSYAPLYKPSYVPSYKPSKVSYAPSYKPSYAPSYKPSKISYAPLYKPSYVPSYKPSKISYAPLYKPSYVPSYKPSKVSYAPLYKPSYVPSYKPSKVSYRPPLPLIGFPFFPGISVSKRKKRIKGFKPLKYMPSLVPVAKELYGPKPKLLTGLEPRFLQAF